MTGRKGIILAGGTGSRLFSITMGVSKQLLPVHDKSMIYHPLTALMLAGIRDIAVITTPRDRAQFQRKMGDGAQWGVSLTYIEQPSPDGLAPAYLLAEDFLNGAPSAMVLGDNIFFGHGLPEMLAAADRRDTGGTAFGYHVSDPERYGVIGWDADGNVTEIVENPSRRRRTSRSRGCIFWTVRHRNAPRSIPPSERGELKIVTLPENYRSNGVLQVERMGRGYVWLDTGTHGSLLDAGNFICTLTERQGLQIGSPDEVGFRAGWISTRDLGNRAGIFEKTDHGK